MIFQRGLGSEDTEDIPQRKYTLFYRELLIIAAEVSEQVPGDPDSITIQPIFSFILVASSFIVTLFIDRQTSCLFHSRDCFYIIVCTHVFFLKVIKNFKSQSSDDSNDVQIETSDSSVPKSLTNYITLSFVLVRKTERTQMSHMDHIIWSMNQRLRPYTSSDVSQ